MKKKIIPGIIVLILAVATYFYDLEEPAPNPITDTTEVHFIDVGQGDASLIIAGSDAILIDGGKNSVEEEIVEFIKNEGITTIDLIIGTHGHEDHIGGLDAVMENFKVEELLMPNVPYNTKTYEDVITAANENDVLQIYPEDRTKFAFKNGVTLELITPPPSYESNNTNNDSIVCVVYIGETSILYTGDMESDLEREILSKVHEVDILKVGHHGSETSSSIEFLEKANPKEAVISVGKDNSYGHPHAEVIDRLEENGIKTIRTDLDGTISYEFNAEEVEK